MSKLHTHCQCDQCTGEDCDINNQDAARKRRDELIRKEERLKIITAIFPRPSQSDLKSGWGHDYQFIQKISERTEELSTDDYVCMETVDILLTALEDAFAEAE